MCNLYSLTKGQAAIRDWFRARHDRAGNLPLLPGIFSDQMAPIVRASIDGERELVMARWGMPGPPQYGGAPVTNIRNLDKPALAGMAGPAQPLPGSRDLVFASTPTRSRARRRFGLPWTRIGRCSPSRGCGRTGAACAVRRTRRSRASISCLAF
jgi:hypothetical protein